MFIWAQHDWLALAVAFAIGWGCCCGWIFIAELLAESRLVSAWRRQQRHRPERAPDPQLLPPASVRIDPNPPHAAGDKR